MIDVRPTGTLDAYALRACCRTNSFDQLRIDLTQCGFIRPAGLVFLGVCLEAATSMRTHRQIEADPQSEVAKYIDRLGLSTLARRCQAVGSQQLPVVRQHAADDRFIELTRFDSTGDTIIEDVCRIIRTRAGLWSADPQRLYNSIFELGYNVEQHAASTGLVAVQHYPNQRIVEFAVGDHGIGIEGSLKQAGLSYASTEAAIRAAVETDATGSADSGRGKGLPSLRHQVCEVLRGSLIVQSGAAQVEYRSGHQPRSFALAYSSPGTLAVGQITTSEGPAT